MKRCGRFTASEIHKLMPGKNGKVGTGAMTYILTKAAELLTNSVKEEVNFKQAEYAHATEPYAVAHYEAVTGHKGVHYGASNPKFFEHGKYAGCSPDWESLTLKHGAEIKTPFNSTEHLRHFMLRSPDELREYKPEYYHQIQHQLYVRGFESWDFVSYDDRMIEPQYKIKILTVFPSDTWRKEYNRRMAAAVELLEELVYGKTVPYAEEVVTAQLGNGEKVKLTEPDDRPSLGL